MLLVLLHLSLPWLRLQLRLLLRLVLVMGMLLAWRPQRRLLLRLPLRLLLRLPPAAQATLRHPKRPRTKQVVQNTPTTTLLTRSSRNWRTKRPRPSL